jgi:signal transduction histidine kinase
VTVSAIEDEHETGRAFVPFLRRSSALAIVALVAVGLTVGAMFERHAVLDELVARSRAATRTAREAARLAVEQETSVRAFLLSGDRESLAPYLAAERRLPATLATLDGLTDDEPAQQARLTASRDALTRWHRDFATPSVAGRSPVATLAGKALSDRVRESFDELIEASDSLDANRRRARDRFGDFMLVAVLIELAIAGFVVIWLRGRVVAQATAVIAHQRIVEEQNQQLEEQAIALEEQATELEGQTLELEEQANALRASNASLALANEELRAFSYSVAHDLRAPLRSIDGYSHMVLEDDGDRLPEASRRRLERVRTNVQRMGALIDGLLSLTRLSQGEITPAPVDLSALARRVADELSRGDPHRVVEWRIANGMAAAGESSLVRSLLENLLGNAWKFSRDRSPAIIEMGVDETAHDGAHPMFFVRDNGVGFDAAHATQLFRPFSRLHDTEAFEGTGIGLAIVRRIVERHGGRVTAEGQPGTGATIRFTLAPLPQS